MTGEVAPKTDRGDRLTLFLLLGYPGSGKTKFSKGLAAARGYARVSSDEVRAARFGRGREAYSRECSEAVFRELDETAEESLRLRRSVLYDANNNRHVDRAQHGVLAKACGALAVVLWVQTPQDVAWQRELGRRKDPNHVAIQPERYEQLASGLEVPKSDELVIVVDGQVPFDEQLQAFTTQFETIVAPA